MSKHEKYDEVLKLVDNDFTVLLHGERGSGKTTLVTQIAEQLELDFYTLSMTRQTTLSHILGFMNVNGTYIPTQFRKAVEEGGLFLLDELDAADPNAILSLNSLENGYVSFPDKIVQVHEHFRLIATANPFDQHSEYTGRAKLDASTLDRFEKVALPRDPKLEKKLVSTDVYNTIVAVRETISEANENIHISMRDTLRFGKRVKLSLDQGYVKYSLLGGSDYLWDMFLSKKIKELLPQETFSSAEKLWNYLNEGEANE